MAHPIPPQIELGIAQLREAVLSVDKKDVDLLKTPWAELEKSVIKLLGGPFNMGQPAHQAVALGVAGILGERMIDEFKAFWFPNRDSVEGAAIGFPDGIIMLSPFGAAVDALTRGKLELLDGILGDIRRSLAQAKFSLDPRTANLPKLTAEDYARLFDPGFIQFTMADAGKVKIAMDSAPEKLLRDLRDGLSRVGAQLPQEAKAQFEQQIGGALQRMEPGKPAGDQVERAPRVGELVAHLFGTVDGTGFAPEEFWAQVVLPLLFIGAPTQFPPLEQDELEAFKQGVEPLPLFTELVPYQVSANDEGLLGVFPVEDIALLHPAFARAAALRLVKLKRETIAPMIAKFDPNATRDVVQRFTKYLEEKSGAKARQGQQGGTMLDAAVQLLTDLKRAMDKNPTADLCLRRVTEAEASSEGALAALRQALSGPRIILA